MKDVAFTVALLEGCLVPVALTLGWLLNQHPLATFRFDAMHGALGVAATVPPLLVFWACLKCPWPPFRAITKILDETIVPLFRPCGLVQLAILAGLAGVGEETLFRGVLQPAVAEAIGDPYGVWIGLLGAAALFGLLHSITATYAILAGLIGLYLGWLWLACGNLLTPILTHGLYDFVALVYLVQRRPPAQKLPASPEDLSP